MKKILTGIQSTGNPHLGNILGAIFPFINMSNVEDNMGIAFIADLHSLVTIKDPLARQHYVRSIAATFITLGYDTKKSILFKQSEVKEHAELAWYLSCFSAMPMLQNAVSYKDKKESITNVGLFTYPILQAADILLYNADLVPVGNDQKQHIEIAVNIARSINNVCKEELFTIPKIHIENLSLVQGTDGQKMSKSKGNYIDIFLPENELWKVVKKIKTTSVPLNEPKPFDITFRLYQMFANNDQEKQMIINYQNNSYGYLDAKNDLFELILKTFGSEREHYNELMNPLNPEIALTLNQGAAKAREIALLNINKLKVVLGF